MGVLDSVIQIKQMEEAKRNANIMAIPQAINTFYAARQAAQKQNMDQMLQQAQIDNINSEIKARSGQDMIANLLKGSQLKKAGVDSNDKSLYDMGDILIKNSVGVPASVNEFINPNIAENMPQVPLNNSYTKNNNDPYEKVSETDWRGQPTVSAMKAKDEINLQNKQKEQDIKNSLEVSKEAELEKKRIDSEKLFAQDMLSSISEVENGIKYFGAMGNLPAFPTEYNKVNWQANLDKLVSQNVLNTLRDLKGQSKTGSTGFGQLSNKELGILMNASTVLKKGMSEEDAKRYLSKMKEPLQKITNSVNDKKSYKVGDVVSKGGNDYKIVNFDTDGEPLVEILSK